jgi:hypothetical protein
MSIFPVQRPANIDIQFLQYVLVLVWQTLFESIHILEHDNTFISGHDELKGTLEKRHVNEQ